MPTRIFTLYQKQSIGQIAQRVDPGSAIFNYHAASAGTGTIPVGRAGIPRNLIGIETPADSAIRARQVLLRSKPLHFQLLDPRYSAILLDVNFLDQLSCLATHESLPESLRWTQSRRTARSAHLRMFSLTTPIIAFLVLPVHPP